MEHLQRQYNNKVVPDEAEDGVGQSSLAVEDLAPSAQPAVEERIKYNTQNKQYQPKRRSFSITLGINVYCCAYGSS
ncbi:hypothetical protein AMTR_s00023p00246200 [Amborella trichopoda]|uniref:Uncharacterized protein n=1 Tax=Amborella trichopoda TaxID=13333 RepID=W1NJR7_AMBTC|nr:hypothetical protein AMTR_s00023p00246200 [Amborella trichopoda]